jgi:uncharacterized protein YecE (DUF72 family)
LKAKRPRPEPPLPDPELLARASALSEKAPLPARLGPLRFATAGWTDRTLIASGAFYPPAAKTPEARLRHYAAHFSLVEVDATYYALLPPTLAERWLAWTPPDFRFDVKAFPLFTGHPIDISRLPTDLKAACIAAGHVGRAYADKLPGELRREIASRFVALLQPLLGADRLSSVLLQFPPWFTATRGNMQKLEALRTEHPDLPFSVEFRHASWLLPERQPRVFERLRELEMSYVCVDEPGLPAVVAVTNPKLSLLRFHGHNRANWQKKGATVHERFDYLYDPAELTAWVAPIRELAQETEEVHVVFNNCVRNYAVLGAKDLAVLVENEASG